VIVKEAVNKSNHPIQNPLLLVTEPEKENTSHTNTTRIQTKDKNIHATKPIHKHHNNPTQQNQKIIKNNKIMW
jgi:hypothetical protein